MQWNISQPLRLRLAEVSGIITIRSSYIIYTSQIRTTQCVTPYVGDGSLCVLDSDGDGYPDQALRNCSTHDHSTYCSTDTCPFAPNHNQDDRTPCIGDETGKWPTCHVHIVDTFILSILNRLSCRTG